MQVNYGGLGTVEQVATDADGNAIVLAWYTDPQANVRSLVESFAASNGEHRWSRDWPRRPGAIAVDSNHAIVFGGELSSAAWAVEKLDASGQTLWSTTSPATGMADVLRTVAVDASDDIIVSGSRLGPGLLHRIATIKLSGGDGSEIWNQHVQGAEDTRLTDMVVDEVGNVLVAGIDKPRLAHAGNPIFARLASATGTIEWLTSLPSTAARRAAYDVVSAVTHDGEIRLASTPPTGSDCGSDNDNISDQLAAEPKWRHHTHACLTAMTSLVSLLAVQRIPRFAE